MKQKNKKEDFTQCYQGHQLLYTSILGNALTGKRVIQAGERVITAVPSF